jgi:hypothetical protein
VASLRRSVIVLLCGLACIQPVRVHPAAAPEEPVKAVFLFNFAHFVQWPAGTFATSTQPFVIALAGGEELVPYLEEVVRGETVNGHPLRVTPLRGAPQLPRILQDAPPGALTVSDLPDSARNGVMIELVNERNRIRLRVNLAAARAAGLTISSNLLRPAEIVGNGGR